MAERRTKEPVDVEGGVAVPNGEAAIVEGPVEVGLVPAADSAELAAASVDAEGDRGVEIGDVEAGSSDEAGLAPAPDPTASEPVPTGERLEAIVESLLFAASQPLTLADLKRLTGERALKNLGAALESLAARRAGTGIEVVAVAGGFTLRTPAQNAPWVARLLQTRGPRLSRAMMETLAIVAYRQPVTRPEIDDIRGVDCGPVLKTLLERGLIRMIGKKEEVGRPILYGTTPSFLRVFNLKDLADLPTLREFHELSAEDQAKVDTEFPADEVALPATAAVAVEGGAGTGDEENDALLAQLESASQAAAAAVERAAEPAAGGGAAAEGA